MTEARQCLLVRSLEGSAELLADGATVWTSDNDPDVLEELGTDAVRDEDIGDILDYLVETKVLSEDEADDCVVDSPEDDDEDAPEDEDEGDELENEVTQ